jgi:hypothetical protein
MIRDKSTIQRETDRSSGRAALLIREARLAATSFGLEMCLVTSFFVVPQFCLASPCLSKLSPKLSPPRLKDNDDKVHFCPARLTMLSSRAHVISSLVNTCRSVRYA